MLVKLFVSENHISFSRHRFRRGFSAPFCPPARPPAASVRFLFVNFHSHKGLQNFSPAR
jgi:hypothetical protein